LVIPVAEFGPLLLVTVVVTVEVVVAVKTVLKVIGAFVILIWIPPFTTIMVLDSM
jgi:hypothetical protein